MKYMVNLCSVGPLSASVEIEAASQQEAQEQALASIKYLEWKAEDIELDETFVVSISNREDPLDYT